MSSKSLKLSPKSHYNPSMPEHSLTFDEVGMTSISKLKFLETIRVYSTLQKGALKNEAGHHNKSKIIRPRPVKLMDITYSATGEW